MIQQNYKTIKKETYSAAFMNRSTGVIHSSTLTLSPNEWNPDSPCILPTMPLSHVMMWCFAPGRNNQPNRRRQGVCVWASQLLCVFMGVHTHTHTWAKLRRGDFSQIVFQFLHHPFPSLPCLALIFPLFLTASSPPIHSFISLLPLRLN